MDIRPITRDDIDACQAVFDDSYYNLHERYGMAEEPDHDPWLSPILEHFLDTDPAGGRLAVEGDEPVAFASSIRRGNYWFLSFLFVRSAHQGRGVGRQLLGALLPEPGDGVALATVVESFQPVSTALYGSVGITPRSVKYLMSGANRVDAMPRLPPDVKRSEMSDDDAIGVDALDRRVLGFTRRADHVWWAKPHARRWVWRRDGRVVAYAYDDDGFIAPALATDDDTLCAAVADVVRGSTDPRRATVNVCGDASALFQMLLDAGAQIDGSSAYRYVYCSNTGPLPTAYVHHSDWLP